MCQTKCNHNRMGSCHQPNQGDRYAAAARHALDSDEHLGVMPNVAELLAHLPRAVSKERGDCGGGKQREGRTKHIPCPALMLQVMQTNHCCVVGVTPKAMEGAGQFWQRSEGNEN